MATTGVVATVAAGVLSPMAANKANTAGRLLQLALCDTADANELDEALTDPGWHELLLPVAIGSGPVPRATGGLAFTAVALLGATVACVVLAHRLVTQATPSPTATATNASAAAGPRLRASGNASGSRSRKVVGILFAVLLNFYGPNIVATAVPAAQLPSPLGAGATVAAGVAGLVVVAVGAALSTWSIVRLSPDAAVRVHRSLMTRAGGATDAAAELPADDTERLGWVLAAMVESARDPVPQHVRLHVVEDFAAAVLLALAEGLSPTIGCGGSAIGIIVVALAHVAYVVLLRPYRQRAEQVFAALLALVQCVLGLAVGIVALRPGRETHGALVAAAWATVAMNVLFYAQMLVLTLLELRDLYRKSKEPPAPRTSPALATDGSVAPGVDDATTALSVPMLERPAADDSAKATQRNPLAET